MLSLTAGIFLTGLCLFQFVVSNCAQNEGQDTSQLSTTKIIFPSELKDYQLPCQSSNGNNPCVTYHNHEGYSSGDYQYNRGHVHGSTYHQDHPYPAFPPGFKHSVEFHERSFGNRGAKDLVQEPLESKAEGRPAVSNTTLNAIPLHYLEEFDNLDVHELLSNYVEGYTDNNSAAKPSFINRFADDSQERNAGFIPTKATCAPELTSISLANSEDPTVVYIPKCTRIERCGGCCSHKLLSCQPIAIETVSVQVVKTQYTGNKKLKYLGKEIIPLEKHTKCKCDCRIKAEHCLPHQVYNPNECSCICMNSDEQEKCYKDSDKKDWDLESCTCRCKNIIMCSTGSVFDHNECRCKALPKRRYAKIEKKDVDDDLVEVPAIINEY